MMTERHNSSEDQLRFGSNMALTVLSRLLLAGQGASVPEAKRDLSSFNGPQLDELLALANSHHVVIRALRRLVDSAAQWGHSGLEKWATDAIQRETARINNALSHLQNICFVLQSAGCDAIVIKSLDHWPDLGSDIDLYIDGEPNRVVRVMTKHFAAELAPRSWGDRLANKWNFIVPGLPELVEAHIGRLGQTGEQIDIAHSLGARARSIEVEQHWFRVPSPADRLMICTLQRMYRHFYIRLCDIVDTANLLETDMVDFDVLRVPAQAAGIWEGVATLLTIVSEYVACYRGQSLRLPARVLGTARFGADQVRFGGGFLRVPILPHAVKLYAAEWLTLMRKGELRNTARLSLLPCLATAAAVGFRLTGSDKGIW